MYSVKDVVATTNLSRSTIYVQMKSGRLRSVKVGSRRLIPESALIDYIDNLREVEDPTEPETPDEVL